jgi:release factor glutamine methyltransferase
VESIQSLLNKSRDLLESKGIPEARLSSELMLSRVLGMRRLDLYLRFDRPVTEPELVQYRALVRRRLQREPVQYILGSTEFYGLEFQVTKDVLIPRPETEHLVDRALQLLTDRRAAGTGQRVLDIGTGSGCIAISICRNCESAFCLAVDASRHALDIARSNSERNGVQDRISFEQVNVFSEQILGHGEFDIIVSNPPYLTDIDLSETQPEVRLFEPADALSDHGDGTAFHKRLAEIGRPLLTESGFLLFEIGYGQTAAVTEILQAYRYSSIEIMRDYAGIDRVAIAAK